MENQSRTCHFCETEEGELRPVGGFRVELQTIEIGGTKKLACQSCQRKIILMLENNNFKKGYTMKTKELFKKILYWVIPVLVLVILLGMDANAQGLPGLPGFPDDPAAAPIDGGLGLLAAAGGSYAWKKLRDKKKEEETGL